ncbi:hypothetical protein G9A89_008056 [Geosiphon pyriformis]|nr:hypothetical protein G9A89_008056 [Geosiphon pyriformis]
MTYNSGSLSVYTDGSLKDLGTVGCKTGTAAFFKNINLSLEVGVSGLMSSTMAKLQAIALALECVSVSSSVYLFLDSQFALNACKLELGLNLRISWHKVKSHFGVLGNKHTNVITGAAFFFMADDGVISGNSRHFVCNIYYSVCHACWEVGSGFKFLIGSLISKIDWLCSSLVWHSDSHMATGFTSRLLANIYTYFIKALHHQLLVAIWKCLYSRLYLSVLCLYCGDIEVSDYVFSCRIDGSKVVSGLSHFFSGVLQLLSSCSSNSLYCEAVFVFYDPKVAGLKVVKFVQSFGLAFRNDVWSVHAKH